MDFRVFNGEGLAGSFLVVDSVPTLAVCFREKLRKLSLKSEEHGRGAWEYSCVVGTDKALQFAADMQKKPSFLVIHYGDNTDISKLVEAFQIPVLIVLGASVKFPYDWLAPDVIYGFLENAANEPLFVAILQMYWMTMALKGLQDAGVVLGGVIDGK